MALLVVKARAGWGPLWPVDQASHGCDVVWFWGEVLWKATWTVGRVHTIVTSYGSDLP